MITTKKAAEKLNRNLIEMLYATDVGFRVSRSVDPSGRESCSIKLDHRGPGDETIESYGVRLLVDPSSAPSLHDYKLDYDGQSPEGFVFKQSVRSRLAEQGEVLFDRFLVMANNFVIVSTSFMDRIVLIWH